GYRLVGVSRSLPQSNLLPALDAMFGHEELLAELEAALVEGARTLCLVGPFGVGKTRLACALGERLRAAFRGGVWLVELQTCADTAAVIAAIVRTLRLAPARDREAGLGERLSALPPLLLLLDNFEQLPPAVDAQVADWLRRVPSLSVVITSRRRVAVPGARLVEVPPLSAEDACDLLQARAAAGGRDLSGQEALCRGLIERLDRQPLAIELAAVQTRHLSVPALLERLGPAVYQGHLEDLLASTCETLSAPALAVLEHCAVFAGGFTAEALEAVMGQPVLAELAELRAHSLVQARPVGAGVRLRLLESVQQLTVARSGPRHAAACAAHARWAAGLGLRLAERIERTGDSDAWAVLELERESLLAAWRRSPPSLQKQLVVGMGPILSELPEALEMLQAALETATPQEQGALHTLRGRLLRLRGQLSEAEQALTTAQALLPDDALMARVAVLTLAFVAIDRGDFDTALPLLEALHTTEPPDAIAGAAAAHRGRGLRGQGKMRQARVVALEGEDILKALGARRLLATAYGILAVLFEAGEKLAYLREALQIHREEGNLRGEGVALSNLVNALADLEQWDEVWSLAEQARAAHQAIGARRSEGILLSNLCAIALSCWQMERAEALGQQALRICRAHGITFFEGQTLLNLGIGALAARRREEALDQLTAARAVFSKMDNTVMVAVTDGVLAAAEATASQPAAARDRLARIEASGVLESRPVLAACIYLQRGFLELAEGEPDAASARLTSLMPGGALPPELDTTEVRGMARLLREAITR
ncbi:MAG: tetratricopeptide (TPR) repeat protein, partial [Myxococcota bacterium]